MTSMKIHPSITAERVIEACKLRDEGLDNPGFCLFCGEYADCCEPDARGYKCDNCEHNTVYGAEETLLMIA